MQQFSPTPTSTATVAATPAAFLGTAAAASHGTSAPMSPPVKVPRRKPGARECMQISRRFGANVIPQKYMDILLDYCTRGKVEHLIRMRERLDDHSRSIELQLAGLESIVKQKGEITAVVPPAEPDSERADEGRPGGAAGGGEGNGRPFAVDSTSAHARQLLRGGEWNEQFHSPPIHPN